MVGLVHQNGKKASYKQHFETNYITLKNLLLALREIKKPPENIIFTSTVNVYGAEIDSKIFNEDSQTAPKTLLLFNKKTSRGITYQSKFSELLDINTCKNLQSKLSIKYQIQN